ncbi:hypothetical protein ACFQV4_17045 [Streptomyces thermocarboxydus]
MTSNDAAAPRHAAAPWAAVRRRLPRRGGCCAGRLGRGRARCHTGGARRGRPRLRGRGGPARAAAGQAAPADEAAPLGASLTEPLGAPADEWPPRRRG